MKKGLFAVFHFLAWVLYFLFTMEARSRFMAGTAKGMHCYKTETRLNSFTDYFDPKTKPYREYITWREFWKQRGYYQTQ